MAPRSKPGIVDPNLRLTDEQDPWPTGGLRQSGNPEPLAPWTWDPNMEPTDDLGSARTADLTLQIEVVQPLRVALEDVVGPPSPEAAGIRHIPLIPNPDGTFRVAESDED